MKKLALLLTFFAITGIIQAQESKSPKMRDYAIMKDGKMMVMKDGKSSAIDKELTLTDGTRIMADGKVMMKDGSTKILREGETISLDSRPKKP